jgi:hypothetical protein
MMSDPGGYAMDRSNEILAAIQSLQEEVRRLRSSASNLAQAGRSAEINELASALAKAQAEMKLAGLDSANPYFKSRYADFASIVKASRPALTKHGLCVTQQIIMGEEGQNILLTRLLHASGQFLESMMRIIPAKNDLQTLGSYLTYLKRYAYAAIVGVVASDEDDDGEVAMAPARTKQEKGVELNTKYDPREESHELISKDQIAEIEYELAAYPDIAEMVLDGLKLQSIADMPKSKYRASIERIRAIKNARNGVK